MPGTPPQGLSVPLTQNSDLAAVDEIYSPDGANIVAQIRNGPLVALGGGGGGQSLLVGEFNLPGVFAFPVPAGVTSVIVTAAAGGSGGNGSTAVTGGGGGGAGEAIFNKGTPVVAGEVLTVTVAGGGAGGAIGGIAAVGGVTSIVGSISGALISLAGGTVGTVFNEGNPGAFGAGSGATDGGSVAVGSTIGGRGGSNIAGGVGAMNKFSPGPSQVIGFAHHGGGGGGGMVIPGGAPGGPGASGFASILFVG